MPRSRLLFLWLAPLAMAGVGALASSCAVGAEDTGTSVDQPEAAAAAPDTSSPDGADGTGATEPPGDAGGTGPSESGGDDGATGPSTGDDASDDGESDGDVETGGGIADAGDAGRTDAGTGDAGNEHDGGDASVVDAGGTHEDAGHDAGDASTTDSGSTTDAGHDAGDASLADAGADSETADACGPSAAFLVINEVQTSGPGGAEDEWVEIYNPLGCPVDISSWELRHTSISGTSIDKVFTAAAGTVIAAGGYGVVAGLAYSASAPTIGSFDTGVLADDGGGLGLYDASGTLIDSMGYGVGATNPLVEIAPAPVEGTSQSIARIPNGAETGDNAVDFQATTPTPGTKN